MADQKLGIEIDTTSNVPQQLDKAKSSVLSFSKQVEDIQKKFSTAFKDIFLGFLAPMVIVQNIIGFISGEMEKAKQMAKDGLELVAKGETTYANAEEKKMANFFKMKQQREEEQRMSMAGIREMTVRFLEQTKEGQDMVYDFNQRLKEQLGGKAGPYVGATTVAGIKEYQDAALKAFLASPEGKAYQPIFGTDQKPSNFKAPEGVNAVVGMGSNAAMQAMLDSLEEQRKQTYLLEQIAQSGGTLPSDFTKTTTSAPSRSYLLTK